MANDQDLEKLNSTLIELDQAARKLLFLWDKQIEAVEAALPEVAKDVEYSIDQRGKEIQKKAEEFQKEATREVNAAQKYFQTHSLEQIGEDVEKEAQKFAKKLDRQFQAASKEAQTELNTYVDGYRQQFNEFVQKVDNMTKEAELKFNTEPHNIVANLKQRESDINFSIAMKNLQKAFSSLGESIQTRLEGLKQNQDQNS